MTVNFCKQFLLIFHHFQNCFSNEIQARNTVCHHRDRSPLMRALLQLSAIGVETQLMTSSFVNIQKSVKKTTSNKQNQQFKMIEKSKQKISSNGNIYFEVLTFLTIFLQNL